MGHPGRHPHSRADVLLRNPRCRHLVRRAYRDGHDLYRFKLYDSLRLPRPKSPALERKQDGPRVTNLLWGGLDEPGLDYVDPPADGASTS